MTDEDIFAVTATEGGTWIPWIEWWSKNDLSDPRVHSILWDDGRTWDAISGWRGEGFSYSVREMIGVLDYWKSLSREERDDEAFQGTRRGELVAVEDILRRVNDPPS